MRISSIGSDYRDFYGMTDSRLDMTFFSLFFFLKCIAVTITQSLLDTMQKVVWLQCSYVQIYMILM